MLMFPSLVYPFAAWQVPTPRMRQSQPAHHSNHPNLPVSIIYTIKILLLYETCLHSTRTFAMASRKSARLAPPGPRTTLNDSPSRWDDWVPQERLRKLTEENIELSKNLKKEMDAQRRATLSKPPPPLSSGRKRAFGSDVAGSSARGSEERASAAAAPAPRGTKRGREYEGIDKVSYHLADAILLAGAAWAMSLRRATHIL